MSRYEALKFIVSDLDTFREEFKQARIAQGWSHEKVSVFADCSRTVVRGFEDGDSIPRIGTLLKLALLLDRWEMKVEGWKDDPDDPDYVLAKSEGRVSFNEALVLADA